MCGEIARHRHQRSPCGERLTGTPRIELLHTGFEGLIAVEIAVFTQDSATECADHLIRVTACNCRIYDLCDACDLLFAIHELQQLGSRCVAINAERSLIG